MKVYTKLHLQIIIFCFIALNAYGQKDSNFLLEKEMSTPLTNNEVVYIKTSKNIYEPGEDLWFRSFILNTQTHILSSASNIFYLELIKDGATIPIWQEKYKIDNGCSFGHVYLPDTLSQGSYSLIGYTRFSICKSDTIVKSLTKVQIEDFANSQYKHNTYSNKEEGKDSITNTLCSKDRVLNFNMFPEGGNLIAGVPNKIAFNGLNKKNESLNIKGYLYENDSPIQYFESIHDGMGFFYFTPDIAKEYLVKIQGSDKEYALPEIKKTGMNLQLSHQNDSLLYFKVVRNGIHDERFYIKGQVRGKTYCVAHGTCENKTSLAIPLKYFTTQGIAEFTLFSEDSRPLSKRFVYVNHKKKLHVEVGMVKQKFETREKIKLTIKTTDNNGLPVEADVAISVFDKIYKQKNGSLNIITHCSLINDFNSTVKNPQFYLKNNSLKDVLKLDLMLLNKKWKDYAWQCNDDKSLKPLLTETIQGKSTPAQKSKNIYLLIYNPEVKERQLLKTDSTGNFHISNTKMLNYYGHHNYIRPLDKKADNIKVEFEDAFDLIDKKREQFDFVYPVYSNTHTKNQDKYNYKPIGGTYLLDDIVVDAKFKGAFRDKYIGFLDSLTQLSFDNPDYVGIPCGVLNCPFHNSDKSKKPVNGETYYVHLDKSGNIIGEDYPYKYWFGTTTIVYGEDVLSEDDLLRMNNLWRFKAFYPNREFQHYNPSLNEERIFTPDFRNTIAWYPSIKTNANGIASVEFYCSDINSKFICEIEGVSKDGLLGAEQIEFDVQKTAPYPWEFKN